jgi:hypothetical protein
MAQKKSIEQLIEEIKSANAFESVKIAREIKERTSESW